MLIKFENESSWLEYRKRDVTSTEMAALFGLSSYKSRLQLWHEKAGNVEPDDLSDNPFAIWGKRLQVVVGMGICEDRGWTGQDLSLYYFHEAEPGMGASMDILATDAERGRGLLEVKTTGYFSEENGWTKESAPIEYEFQIQTQLHLAERNNQGIKWGAIGALSGRKESRVLPRMYDPQLGALMDEEVSSFQRSLKLNEPPAPDYKVDSKLLEKLRGPLYVGKIAALTGNNRAMELIESYWEITAEAETARRDSAAKEEKKAACRAELLDLMGDAESAEIGPYIVKARIQHVEEKIVYGYDFRRFDVTKTNKGRKRQ